MFYFVLVLAFFIGLLLGLLGGGGSILTVPALVYLMHLDPVVATAYSLFIVGISSLTGALRYVKHNYYSLKFALLFGLPSMAAVFATRTWLVPALPDELISTTLFVLTKQQFLMGLFAVLMLFTGIPMIGILRQKSKPQKQANSAKKLNLFVVFSQGSFVGLMAGLVGAGGGFLIVPALNLLAKLDIKKSIGTSLIIIAANSLFGFAGDALHRTMEWDILLPFAAITIAGVLVSTAYIEQINSEKLKKGFGYLTLMMAVYIVVKEFF